MIDRPTHPSQLSLAVKRFSITASIDLKECGKTTLVSRSGKGHKGRVKEGKRVSSLFPWYSTPFTVYSTFFTAGGFQVPSMMASFGQ